MAESDERDADLPLRPGRGNPGGAHAAIRLGRARAGPGLLQQLGLRHGGAGRRGTGGRRVPRPSTPATPMACTRGPSTQASGRPRMRPTRSRLGLSWPITCRRRPSAASDLIGVGGPPAWAGKSPAARQASSSNSSVATTSSMPCGPMTPPHSSGSSRGRTGRPPGRGRDDPSNRSAHLRSGRYRDV